LFHFDVHTIKPLPAKRFEVNVVKNRVVIGPEGNGQGKQKFLNIRKSQRAVF